ncbi:MAG TPA: DUF423 domain-containing protein [Fimbriimonas sp.]|nr:DUF423 domain-containing protein [Fimbriimonas sp.]
MKLVSYGAILGFLAVALGAFGTHGLKDRLTPEMMQVWETGTHYHLAHAIAMVLAGIVYTQNPKKEAMAAGILFGIGTLIFSGSLYALALSGVKILGAITPLGGLCYLAGWICLAVGAAKR